MLNTCNQFDYKTVNNDVDDERILKTVDIALYIFFLCSEKGFNQRVNFYTAKS